MGRIVALCIGRKGEPKRKVGQVSFSQDFGLSGDCHAGKNKLQVSVISLDRLKGRKDARGEPVFGSFGENMVVEGLDLAGLKPGDQLVTGDVILSVLRTGKQGCLNDVMGEHAVFCRVVHRGIVNEGDGIDLY